MLAKPRHPVDFAGGDEQHQVGEVESRTGCMGEVEPSRVEVWVSSRPCSRSPCRTGRLPNRLLQRCKEVNPVDRGPRTPNAGWCCLQIPGCCSSCLSKAPVQWQLLALPLPSASSIGTRLGGALRSKANDTIPTPTLSTPAPLSWFVFSSFYLSSS